MRVMFISLLLSVTIGNALYAMEKEEDGMKTIALAVAEYDNDGAGKGIVPSLFTVRGAYDREEGSDHDVIKLERVDALSSSRESTGLRCPTFRHITDLDGVAKLSKQILARPKTRSRHKNKIFPELEEFDIPEGTTIDSQVFIEHAIEEHLVIESKPGLCERFRHRCCCSSDKKNPFGHLLPEKHKMWAQALLAIYSSDDNSTEATTRARYEDTNLLPNEDTTSSEDNGTQIVQNDANVTVTQKVFQLVVEGPESDGDEEERSRILTERQLKWQYRQEKEKNKLNKDMLKFLLKQQKGEANSSRWKERGAELFIIVGSILVTYYEARGC